MGLFTEIIKTAGAYVIEEPASNAVDYVLSKSEQAKIKKRKRLLDDCAPGKRGFVLMWDRDGTEDNIEVSGADGVTKYFIRSAFGGSKRNLNIYDASWKKIAKVEDQTDFHRMKGTYTLVVGKNPVGFIAADIKDGAQEFMTSDGIRIYRRKMEKKFYMYAGGGELGTISPKGGLNFWYILNFPEDAPDLMFLFIALVVYIFNAGSKKEARKRERDLDVY